jgi:hypothetical protein
MTVSGSMSGKGFNARDLCDHTAAAATTAAAAATAASTAAVTAAVTAAGTAAGTAAAGTAAAETVGGRELDRDRRPSIPFIPFMLHIL